MRKAAATLAVIALALLTPASISAEELCCVGKPYPGLGPPEDPMCYEGVKIYDNDGRMIGCVGFEGGNCLFCEAVIHVGTGA